MRTWCFWANLTFGPGKPSPRGPFSPWTPCGPWGPWLDEEGQMSYNQFYGCKFNVLISKQLCKLNMFECLLLYLQADLARLCHVDPEDPISPEIPYLPTDGSKTWTIQENKKYSIENYSISENPQPFPSMSSKTIAQWKSPFIHLLFKLSKTMQFGADADIYKAKFKTQFLWLEM